MPSSTSDGVGSPQTNLGLREAVDAYQKQLIQSALERHQYRWADVARALGLDRANLNRLARRLGVK
ncbi:anaerobic nitric oxide reductase transcription regulator [Pseudomonas duriflava]|uniref:Anaerobic nitric oxide reductase transcription regulator n=1 Tax=Pseudomonas duriflava TaxID=459528 RepID=A0A562QPK8_9PSED|nr:anaerobic nitric oxide reductase transcription regulator [Pseudomonas duriflava]